MLVNSISYFKFLSRLLENVIVIFTTFPIFKLLICSVTHTLEIHTTQFTALSLQPFSHFLIPAFFFALR